MRELKSIEEKILDRALYLISKNRSSDVSIRAIAKEAKVNVSAINYYFRTKEEMLRQVKEFYITNTSIISSMLDNEESDEEERLILTANEIMEYTLRFPGITAILREAASLKDEDDISKKIMKASKDMNDKIEKILCNIIKGNSLSCKYNQMIFMSSIIYPIENEDIINFEETIIKSRDSRIEYIKYIINALKRA
ncbi:TetR/AcrR family transcriptional regulator [Candidatus Clostridium radicumherbarum]|uniref:TetR/AcrR family transcriptional regulator n=1 Tax=Candidatus Clostridium radicumherbarum TaxID=3381662 RepID=A0ABW8TTC0_9CLOT